jgi:hypothetical protein
MVETVFMDVFAGQTRRGTHETDAQSQGVLDGSDGQDFTRFRIRLRPHWFSSYTPISSLLSFDRHTIQSRQTWCWNKGKHSSTDTVEREDSHESKVIDEKEIRVRSG